jgi:gentisate 1,2-dioxygenase
MVFCAVEGRGRCMVGEQRFDFGPRDIFTVPGWMAYTLEAEGGEDVVLFSYSDRVAQEKLGIFRERRG